MQGGGGRKEGKGGLSPTEWGDWRLTAHCSSVQRILTATSAVPVRRLTRVCFVLLSQLAMSASSSASAASLSVVPLHRPPLY
jgi:hypothetical protein